MSHELTQRIDGKTEFAFTGSRDKIWHGLGSQLEDGASIDTWKKESGLDWEIFESGVSYQSMEGSHSFPSKKVLFRSDTKVPLSIVGTDYNIVQPSEVLEFFRDLTELHGFKLSAAGSIFGGKRFWATAEVGKTFEATKDDTINGQLLLVTSCDGSIATTAKLVSTRTVCNNTLTVALNEFGKPTVRKTHASAFDPTAFKLDLGLIDSSWETFAANIKKLTEVEVTDKFAKSYFEKKFFNPEVSVDEQTTQTYNKVSKVLDLYKNGAGADMGSNSAFAILQAMTNMGTHGLRNKQDPSKKFWESSFGSWDKLKNDAYSDMLAMAA